MLTYEWIFRKNTYLYILHCFKKSSYLVMTEVIIFRLSDWNFFIETLNSDKGNGFAPYSFLFTDEFTVLPGLLLLLGPFDLQTLLLSQVCLHLCLQNLSKAQTGNIVLITALYCTFRMKPIIFHDLKKKIQHGGVSIS